MLSPINGKGNSRRIRRKHAKTVKTQNSKLGNTSWGQACDLCDFGFDSPGCGACAPLFQQAGGHLALTPDLAERLTIKSNSRVLSFYV